MKLRGIALTAALLAAAGCSDTTEPISGFNGALSFTYTGGGGGTHSAEGDFTAGGSSNVDWAYGARATGNNAVGIVSNQPRSSTTHDMLFLAIARTSAGSASFSATCDPEDETEACTGLVFYRGMNTTGTFEFFCTLTSGTVNITSISETRAQGTFSGSGFCFDSDNNDEPFSVMSGTFNVALLDGTLD